MKFIYNFVKAKARTEGLCESYEAEKNDGDWKK